MHVVISSDLDFNDSIQGANHYMDCSVSVTRFDSTIDDGPIVKDSSKVLYHPVLL